MLSGNTLDTIMGEVRRVEELHREVGSLSRQVAAEYESAVALQQYAEDTDDVMLGVGRYWDNYFGPDKELHGKKQQLDSARARLQLHQFSLDSMAGSLLQYAKQGISLVHGNLTGCPNGRLVGTQALKTIVWQGRNQALHWEDGHFSAPVENRFQALTQEQGAKFADYKTRNLAYEVVSLLGWRDFSSFERDMLSLG